MSRVQLALNVSNVDDAVDFYRKMFGVEPAKRHPGYANFAISEPPLKLVLIENAAATERLNHLGVEVESSELVTAAHGRFSEDGLTVVETERVTCCYAEQDKFWIKDPDQAAWEIYTVLADSATFAEKSTPSTAACCAERQTVA